MLRSLLFKATAKHNIRLARLNCQRGMHTINKKAMELIAKRWSALKEVDKVIDYCELNDKRLIPLLRTTKENSELALETDNSNSHARFWLSKLHLKYHVPGACKGVSLNTTTLGSLIDGKQTKKNQSENIIIEGIVVNHDSDANKVASTQKKNPVAEEYHYVQNSYQN
ncbi:hypothetical protein POM88_012054 [Heracleum sosnowskyi]|uniref:Uncharacterized protein n=1 Tax=Heracleum sosnowskyi TaxID=360622 RepID=A0AAD8IXZ1_9APIA|nr:hypothetical protein POM88_012054 [Heracleum sosnowskyi]